MGLISYYSEKENRNYKEKKFWIKLIIDIIFIIILILVYYEIRQGFIELYHCESYKMWNETKIKEFTEKINNITINISCYCKPIDDFKNIYIQNNSYAYSKSSNISTSNFAVAGK